jgi:hypothetical protein
MWAVSWAVPVICAQKCPHRRDPAYRVTLLPIRWAQVETALTFLIYLKQFVTLPIAELQRITGK